MTDKCFKYLEKRSDEILYFRYLIEQYNESIVLKHIEIDDRDGFFEDEYKYIFDLIICLQNVYEQILVILRRERDRLKKLLEDSKNENN